MTMQLRLRAWFPRACVVAIMAAAALALWAAWIRLVPVQGLGMPRWLPAFGMEASTGWALYAWCVTSGPPRRMHACIAFLLACDAGALVATHFMATEHMSRTPLALEIAAAAALDAGVGAALVSLATRLKEREASAEAVPQSLVPAVITAPVVVAPVITAPVVAAAPIDLADPVGMIGRAILGDIGPNAGNARTGTAVYRFFDVTRKPIYTGKSRNFPTRFKDHRREKPWFGDVHHMTVVWYKDEASALAVEEQAIKTEGPRENVTHNPHRKPQQLTQRKK